VTPIVVSIVTEAGLTMPKTSSRAVTSPAGTADVMEVFCDVEFSIDGIESIVAETNGCLVWGGGGRPLAGRRRDHPRREPLSIDPQGQLVASVLSKKRSAGSTHVVIDIPYGEGAKVESLVGSRELADDIKRVGEDLGMDITTCVITHGTDPVGRGVGRSRPRGPGRPRSAGRGGTGIAPTEVDPDRGDPARPLRRRRVGDGDSRLRAGARSVPHRIVAAQNGDPAIESNDLEPGGKSTIVRAERSGFVTRVDNRRLCDLARRAGAPLDARAGLVIHRTDGTTVESGDPLYTIHAETGAQARGSGLAGGSPRADSRSEQGRRARRTSIASADSAVSSAPSARTKRLTSRSPSPQVWR